MHDDVHIPVLGPCTTQGSLLSGSVSNIKRLSLMYVVHVDLSSWEIVRVSGPRYTNVGGENKTGNERKRFKRGVE